MTSLGVSAANQIIKLKLVVAARMEIAIVFPTIKLMNCKVEKLPGENEVERGGGGGNKEG